MKIIQDNWSRRLPLRHKNVASMGAKHIIGNEFNIIKIHFNIYFYIYVTHLHETSRMSAEFVYRYGPKCMGGVILPILVLLHL